MTLQQLPATRIENPNKAPSIRWGVLAPGWIATTFVSDLQKFTTSKVAAVGSRSLDRAQAFANEYAIAEVYGSYEELVAADVDAIYVASPHSEHLAHASLALNAGKPVLIEKAFTKTAAEAEELLNLAKTKNLLVMEAMWTRFLPHIDVVRQLIETGELGEVISVTGDHGQLMTQGPEHRLFNKELAGGALLDLGIYPISFSSMILGTPKTITAKGTLTETDVDEQVSAIFEYEKAHAVINTTLRAKTPTVAVINGTKARIEIAGDFYAPNSFKLIYATGEILEYENTFNARESGLAYQAAHFATLLSEGKKDSPLMPNAESLSIMQTMDEIRRQVGYVFN